MNPRRRCNFPIYRPLVGDFPRLFSLRGGGCDGDPTPTPPGGKNSNSRVHVTPPLSFPLFAVVVLVGCSGGPGSSGGRISLGFLNFHLAYYSAEKSFVGTHVPVYIVVFFRCVGPSQGAGVHHIDVQVRTRAQLSCMFSISPLVSCPMPPPPPPRSSPTSTASCTQLSLEPGRNSTFLLLHPNII